MSVNRSDFLHGDQSFFSFLACPYCLTPLNVFLCTGPKQCFRNGWQAQLWPTLHCNHLPQSHTLHHCCSMHSGTCVILKRKMMTKNRQLWTLNRVVLCWYFLTIKYRIPCHPQSSQVVFTRGAGTLTRPWGSPGSKITHCQGFPNMFQVTNWRRLQNPC